MNKQPVDKAVALPPITVCKHCGRTITLRAGRGIFPDIWLGSGFVFPQYCFELFGQYHEPNLD